MKLARSDRGWISGESGEGIVTIGDPRLKAPTATVTDTGYVAELLETMVARLRSLNGAGLAAPQIGEAVKAVVVEVRRTDVFPTRPTSPLLTMVNPKVIDCSDSMLVDWEGCFSVPGIMGLVPRAEKIVVRYLDPTGQEVTSEHNGYIARVIQHEIDHLNGIEFVDRMTDMASLTTVQNYLSHHRNAPATQ